MSNKEPISRDDLCKIAPNAEECVRVYEAYSRVAYNYGTPVEGETLESVAHAEATFQAHKPLGHAEEQPLPLTKMVDRLATFLKVLRLERRDMTTAIHPDGSTLALRFTCVFKGKFVPCFDLVREPLLFLMEFADEGGKKKISKINEYRAETEEEALNILRGEKYNWPEESKFVNYSFVDE